MLGETDYIWNGLSRLFMLKIRISVKIYICIYLLFLITNTFLIYKKEKVAVCIITCNLFDDAPSENQTIKASNERLMSEWRTEKNSEGSGSGLF
jgi:hypothetical protein